jgi:hypothetical protein
MTALLSSLSLVRYNQKKEEKMMVATLTSPSLVRCNQKIKKSDSSCHYLLC